MGRHGLPGLFEKLQSPGGDGSIVAELGVVGLASLNEDFHFLGRRSGGSAAITISAWAWPSSTSEGSAWTAAAIVRPRPKIPKARSGAQRSAGPGAAVERRFASN